MKYILKIKASWFYLSHEKIEKKGKFKKEKGQIKEIQLT